MNRRDECDSRSKQNESDAALNEGAEAIGMLIGEWIEGTFVPSQELIARFSAQFTGQRFTLDNALVKQWLSGLDLRGVTPPYPTGSIILIEDERQRFIGRGKVLRDRLRNLSPKK